MKNELETLKDFEDCTCPVKDCHHTQYRRRIKDLVIKWVKLYKKGDSINKFVAMEFMKFANIIEEDIK